MVNQTQIAKSAGFSLVEVLVAMGIMGVLSFSIMSLIQMQSKSSGNMNQQADTMGLMDLIHQDLNVSAACSNTMTMQGGPLTFTVPVTPTTTVPLTQIMTGTTTPPPQPVATLSPVPSTFNTIKLTSLSLQNFVQLGANTYSANVVITTAPISSTSTTMTLGAQTFTRTVRISMQVNVLGSTATIMGCSGSATVTDYTGNPARAFDTVYQNTTGGNLIVSGSGQETGSGLGSVRCLVGTANPPTIVSFGNEDPATVDAADAGFICIVPNSYYYEIQNDYNNPGGNPPNTNVNSIEHWVETQF